MGYSIIDILSKLIHVKENVIKEYDKIALSKEANLSIKTIALVLTKEEKRHVEGLNSLAIKLKDKELDVIEFDIYDKISNLLTQFQNTLILPKINNSKSFLHFALEYESRNLALMLDIQGRLVKKEKDTERLSYKVLNKIMEDRKRYMESLKRFAI